MKNRTGTLEKHLEPGSVYRNIVRKYGHDTGINAEVNGLCVHSLRAMAARMPSRTRRTSPRSRNGSGMPTSQLPASTTGAKVNLRTARRFM